MQWLVQESMFLCLVLSGHQDGNMSWAGARCLPRTLENPESRSTIGEMVRQRGYLQGLCAQGSEVGGLTPLGSQGRPCGWRGECVGRGGM